MLNEFLGQNTSELRDDAGQSGVHLHSPLPTPRTLNLGLSPEWRDYFARARLLFAEGFPFFRSSRFCRSFISNGG